MLTAQQARFESTNRRTIDEIKKNIEDDIQIAINAGEFECLTDLDPDVDINILEKVKEEVEALGYRVNIPTSPLSYEQDVNLWTSWEF